jgi:hypothetical protein
MFLTMKVVFWDTGIRKGNVNICSDGNGARSE